MTALTVGAVTETACGERRVGITPDGVSRLRQVGLRLVVETGAGSRAFFPDAAYENAGAEMLPKRAVYAQADVIVMIRPPAQQDVALLEPGKIILGLLQPLIEPRLAADLAAANVTAISLDGLPRTLSRAQSMDALSSQANIAGYKAALLAADAYGALFPMFMTAAGTTRPAQVLVIGAGVAGLQAISTARRLGAVVTGYDVREAARSDILSTGASVLELAADISAAGDGGYARQLTAEERGSQQVALNAALSRFDIVITTAQVPGRRPPVLISQAGLAAMNPGSVIVDLAASELGGNVEGSLPDTTVVTPNGVSVIGAGNLPSAVPSAASTAYSRNVVAMLVHLVHDGAVTLDPSDEITAGVLVTQAGQVVHPLVHALLDTAAIGSGASTSAQKGAAG